VRRCRPGSLLWGLVILGLVAGRCGTLAAWGQQPPTAASALDGGEVADAPVPVAAVQALLAAKCLGCHGNDATDLKGGLDLRTRNAALKGGDSGEPAVVPGQPERSALYRAVTWQEEVKMPPKENDRLTADEVALLRRWIAAGAPWEVPSKTAAAAPPAGSSRASTDRWNAAGGVRVPTSGGLSPAWDERTYDEQALWAYRPLTRPPVPEIEAAGGHPIDAFLLAKLRSREIDSFAPPADRRTLIRRLSFDLTGLPAAPEEVEAFVADTASDAYERLVSRLLDSPRYAEQQARHWLDVVRYADTAGFSNDFERPHAWRYRDYVIRSFQADKPFDRFVLEQLAGDELDPDDPEMRIAVGYLRMGPWEHTGMTVAAVTRQQFLDDVTHHVGVTLLGQGLRCAACHDHKFDPIPTRDYYRLQAVFAPVQFVERPAPFLPQENTAGFESARAQVQARLAAIQEAQAALRRKNEAAIADYLAQRQVRSIDELPPQQRPPRDYLGGTFGLTPTDLSLRKIYQKSQAYLERELKRFEPYALRPVYGEPPARDGAVEVVHILLGGALTSPGEAVRPGFLSAVLGVRGVPQPGSASELPDTVHGRRLALARWITSPDNPLTARVLVNRLWQQHFGKGMVATPNNFGKMGARPTHPELLDWLAGWFMDQGWSLKKLHRLIVTSQAYRQASSRPDLAQLRQRDVHNDWLAYFPARRLAAEEIRDSLLAASGELNLEMGGPGVFPELHWEVALQPRHIMGSVAPAYVPSLAPAQRHRRTIYAFRIRTLPDPLLEVFNRPGSETSCERRDQTTIAPQALTLLNSEFSAQRAVAMARRLMETCEGDEARIDVAVRWLYGRPATAEERARCRAFLTQVTALEAAHPPQPRTLPRSVRRGMVEELTGEMVYWDEDLSVLDAYQPDLTPADVDAPTRALANLCLVLMNSNEFLYVR
jgi:mono/diheme cytochrome c family protein